MFDKFKTPNVVDWSLVQAWVTLTWKTVRAVKDFYLLILPRFPRPYIQRERNIN
jgi:hypothetical protein